MTSMHSIVSAAVALFVLSGAAHSQTLEPDTDRPGRDIAQITTADPQACRAACLAETACVAFTFVPHDGPEGACWLKDAVPEPHSAPGMTSGLVGPADRAAAAPDRPAVASTGTGALGCQAIVGAVAETGRVTLEGVYFDFNRATLRSDSLPALLAARDAIRTVGGTWTVEGHTDNVGGHNYNLRLSLSRAEAVADWLRAAGVPASRIRADGFSFDRPVAANDSEQGRARNRRVELAVADLDPDALGFGGPADVEAEGCAEAAPAVAAGERPDGVPEFGRESGPEWIPHAYFMSTGRSAGPLGASFETADLGVAGSPRQCQAMCLAEEGCVGWSFEPAGSYFVATARCHRWGSSAEVSLMRGGWESFHAGLRPGATILEEGSTALLSEIMADESDLERYRAATAIAAPERVPPNAAFPVRVTGPGLQGDWVEVASLDASGEPYGGLSWKLAEGVTAEGGAVLEIEAPDAGDYALRYVVEHPRAGRRVVHETRLRVEAGAPTPAVP